MPPNRKNTGLFTSNAEYESLKIPIQSKYLPLTDSRSEVVTATSTAPAKVQQQQQQQQQHHQTKLEDDVVSIHQPVAVVVVEEEEDLTYSYWDIPSNIPVEDEKEEIINDLFSLTHIESNMIQDSIVIKKLEEESATTTMKQQQDPESYWTWSNDTDNDWNDTYYDNTIESKSVSVSSPDKDCEDCCQDYWAWESSSAVVDIDESDNDYGVEEDDDVVMMKAATTTRSMSTNNNNVVVDRRKQPAIRNVLTKSWRKHKHLPEPEQPATACSTTTASTSEHYWHWQEFHSKSCSSQ